MVLCCCGFGVLACVVCCLELCFVVLWCVVWCNVVVFFSALHVFVVAVRCCVLLICVVLRGFVLCCMVLRCGVCYFWCVVWRVVL